MIDHKFICEECKSINVDTKNFVCWYDLPLTPERIKECKQEGLPEHMWTMSRHEPMIRCTCKECNHIFNIAYDSLTPEELEEYENMQYFKLRGDN